MIVLDTDVISNLMRARPAPTLLARLADVPAHEQSTTTITLGELAYGAERVRRPELYRRAMGLLGDAHILDFDQAAGERYGHIRCVLEREGKRLADPDLRIAATALAHEATLVTGNTRHFERVPGLTVQNWLHD
jgi:tRNA(fMet)-specific endonuclease VapC